MRRKMRTGRRGKLLCPIIPALLMVATVFSCDSSPPASDAGMDADAGPDGGDPGGWNPPPVDARLVTLDDPFELSVRSREGQGQWGAPVELGPVTVPGFYYLPFHGENRALEYELTFRRAIQLPASWAGAHSAGFHPLVEFESADYFCEAEIEDPQGGTFPLGTHQGYIGRFGFEMGQLEAGTLVVRTRDIRQSTEDVEVEEVARTTVQGIDPTGWGINVTGLIEPVHLRLVGPLYLRNAYVAALVPGDPAMVRFGIEIVPWISGHFEARLDFEIQADGTTVASGSFDVSATAEAPGRPVAVFHQADLVGLPIWQPGESALEANMRLIHQGTITDVRTVYLYNRRLTIESNRFRLGDRPVFLRGGGVYVTSRLLPVHPDATTEPYQADRTHLEGALRHLAESLVEVHADLVRPAHHVPVRPFHQTMRAHGLLVYQDFPLHWNTDYEVLEQDEILRQLDEFLWRVAAEPAVVMVALHNEPEIHDTSGERTRTRDLIQAMIARTREMAPHLVVVGASGCRGTAVFPPDNDLPVPDDVVDAHSYLASHWQPFTGFDQIGEHAGRLAETDGRPATWSEMGGGWARHFDYLLSLDDAIIEDERTQALEEWFQVAGVQLTVRQAYALISCRHFDQVPDAQLADCIEAQAVETNDPLLVARAKDYYFKDRMEILRPEVADPLRWRRRISASWLAAQLYESRLLHLTGGAMGCTVPWDNLLDLGFPAAIDWLGQRITETAPDTRAILAVACAHRTVYARSIQHGQPLPVAVLNDVEAFTGTVAVRVETTPILSREIDVAAHSAALVEVPWSALAGYTGRIVTIELQIGGSPVAKRRLLVPEQS